MKIEERSALIVIDVQGGDMTGTWGAGMEEAEELDRKMIKNAKRVLDVFRAKKLPVIQVKEVHRKDHVDFGRELDGAEGVHLLENDPYTDYAQLTYPIEGEYLITKRRYSCFFGTDLEILLKGLKVDTLYLIGGFTDVCVHYTAVDAHQYDYHFKVVTDACGGSSIEAHNYALKAMQYLQRDALITVADVESTL
ncbi:MAG: cysteine hydrolase [Lachnospiraceae bacterium]|nr:cysteine hydrolase [Lachnospiraceae bacterium]MBO5145656.1 cysteine hydrolase [Lachnospiraceae bacterium]